MLSRGAPLCYAASCRVVLCHIECFTTCQGREQKEERRDGQENAQTRAEAEASRRKQSGGRREGKRWQVGQASSLCAKPRSSDKPSRKTRTWAARERVDFHSHLVERNNEEDERERERETKGRGRMEERDIPSEQASERASKQASEQAGSKEEGGGERRCRETSKGREGLAGQWRRELGAASSGASKTAEARCEPDAERKERHVVGAGQEAWTRRTRGGGHDPVLSAFWRGAGSSPFCGRACREALRSRGTNSLSRRAPSSPTARSRLVMQAMRGEHCEWGRIWAGRPS